MKSHSLHRLWTIQSEAFRLMLLWVLSSSCWHHIHFHHPVHTRSPWISIQPLVPKKSQVFIAIKKRFIFYLQSSVNKLDAGDPAVKVCTKMQAPSELVQSFWLCHDYKSLNGWFEIQWVNLSCPQWLPPRLIASTDTDATQCNRWKMQTPIY